MVKINREICSSFFTRRKRYSDVCHS